MSQKLWACSGLLQRLPLASLCIHSPSMRLTQSKGLRNLLRVVAGLSVTAQILPAGCRVPTRAGGTAELGTLDLLGLQCLFVVCFYFVKLR